MKDMSIHKEGHQQYEIGKVVDFRAGFKEIVEGVATTYTLPESLFSANALAMPDREAMKGPGGLEFCLSRLESDRAKRRAVVGDFVSKHPDRGQKIELGGMAFETTLDHTMGRIINGAAKFKALLHEENGIPVAEPSNVRLEAEEALEVLNQAAELIYKQPSLKDLSLEDVVAMVKPKSKVGKLALGTSLMSSILAACAGGVPTPDKPNFDPGSVTQPAEVASISTETPVPNSETVSSIPARIENMSRERMVELENQYKTGLVHEYVLNTDTGKYEVRTMSAESRSEAAVLTGYSLVVEGGGKSEMIVVSLGGQEVFVRNDGQFMTNLVELEYEGYRVLGEFSRYGIDAATGKPVEVYPDNQQETATLGRFLGWQVMGIEAGEMWTFDPGDNKLHEVEQAEQLFKNAMPAADSVMIEQAESLEATNGNVEYDRSDEGELMLHFNNGMSFVYEGGEWVEAITPERTDVGGNLLAEFGETVGEKTFIKQFFASDKLTPDLQVDKLDEVDYTNLGFEAGSLVWMRNNADGKIELVRADDHNRVVGWWMRSRVTMTTGMVWNAPELIYPKTGESGLFNPGVARVWDTNTVYTTELDTMRKTINAIFQNQGKKWGADRMISTTLPTVKITSKDGKGVVFGLFVMPTTDTESGDGVLFFQSGEVDSDGNRDVKEIILSDFDFVRG